MDISLQTGLPELPEGYFFRISSVQPWAGESFIVFNPKRHELRNARVETVNVAIHERYTAHAYRERTRKFLWFTYVSGQQEKYDRETTRVVAQLSVRRAAVHDDIRQMVYVPAHLVTEEDILETAKAVYEAWQNRIQAAKLMGDYPPKKLVTE